MKATPGLSREALSNEAQLFCLNHRGTDTCQFFANVRRKFATSVTRIFIYVKEIFLKMTKKSLLHMEKSAFLFESYSADRKKLNQ